MIADLAWYWWPAIVLVPIYLVATALIGFFYVAGKGAPLADRVVYAILTPFLVLWDIFLESTGTF